MRITVDRFVSDTQSTVSHVLVDGRMVCFGLEDEYRAKKVKGETRIPAGSYPVRLRTEGGHHARYAERFRDIHKGMLHIQDVPGFEFILVHCGNKESETQGCLLVGQSANTDWGRMYVSRSTAAYRMLYAMVADAAARRELTIEFIDNDR
jgi:hypothetical protein